MGHRAGECSEWVREKEFGRVQANNRGCDVGSSARCLEYVLQRVQRGTSDTEVLQYLGTYRVAWTAQSEKAGVGRRGEERTRDEGGVPEKTTIQ